MNIVVIGGGSLGLIYGAYLSDKNDVTILVRREEQANQINNNGVTVKRPNTEIKASPAASTNSQVLKDTDLAICLTKCNAAETVANTFNKHAGKKTLLLPLHNGLGTLEIYNQTIGQEQVLAGMTLMGATQLSDTESKCGDWMKVCIGNQNNSQSDVINSINNTFNSSGFESTISENIQKSIWDKFAITIGQNALSALTNCSLREMYDTQSAREIANHLNIEFAAVARAEGFKYQVGALNEKLMSNWSGGANHYPSTYQDIQSKRKTEIEFMNGTISKLGKKHKIGTPYNDLITDLIRTLESQF